MLCLRPSSPVVHHRCYSSAPSRWIQRPDCDDRAASTVSSAAISSASESFPSCFTSLCGQVKERTRGAGPRAEAELTRIRWRVKRTCCRRIAYTPRSGSSESATTTVEVVTIPQCGGKKERRRKGEGHCGLRAATWSCSVVSKARRTSEERQARAVSDSSESIPASTRCEASGTSATSSPARKDVTVAIFVPVDDAGDAGAILLLGAGVGVVLLT